MAFLLINLYNQYIRPYIFEPNDSPPVNMYTEINPDIENNLYTILFQSEIEKSGPSDESFVGL